ncbi:unnamed protein product [Cylicocyclus nassatus]|uniref:mannosyl-oligosaccharide 1,2-alpha-mannosidase n=1 Tax=Cylicocyclus nassatus TaxID=53992 RepID=A0AA36DLZ0_CYLNA|nr:unnamed protein product [Cylicocyclus nassatus]
MYTNPTGLELEIAYFNMLPSQNEDLSIKPLDAHSLLALEAIESWFYLYRMTGDKTYQELAGKPGSARPCHYYIRNKALSILSRRPRVRNGYSPVKSVKKIPVTYRDLMELFKWLRFQLSLSSIC